jgi:Zn-finger nucleic acid-binding protein
MNCPVCNVELVMSERQGIEIDYCPKCRGVWLDRGELDKIIERSMSEQRPTGPSYRQDDRYDEHEKHHNEGHGRHRHGKR